MTAVEDVSETKPAVSPDLAVGSTVTIATALRTAAVQRGTPEVIAGRAHLERPVRWVHVAEARDITSVVRGGELLITEGGPFRGPEADQRRFVGELCERCVSGLIFELGTYFQTVPAYLIKEFEDHDLPLIALHLPVPFIEISEAVNTAIVNAKSALLVEGEAIHHRLIHLVREGADVGEVLAALADAVGNPVVFERANGGIAYKSLQGQPERDVFAAWERFAQGLPNAPAVIERRLPEVRGEALGRVVALGLSGPLGPLEETAIDHALDVISLSLWYTRHEDAVAERSNRGFLSALLKGEIASITANNRAVASGFSAPVLLPMAVSRARHHSARLVAVEDRIWSQVWRQAIIELESRHIPVMVDPHPTLEPTLVVVGIEEVSRRSAKAARVAATVSEIAERMFDEPNPVVVCVGPAVLTWPSVVEGLTVAIAATGGAVFSRPRLWHDAVDLDLDRLLWSLRDNPDLARFAELRLGPLLAYDRDRNTQLVATLRVLLEHNGHKADTARALHLERQSLYNRIERMEMLLDVDLSDSDTRLSLHLALHVLSGVNAAT